jgi:demethylmenaquinone methyltransferase/2-methoxy-6-polyprenyl-1,4-benzoquinol methylase
MAPMSTPVPGSVPEPSRREVWKMFDRIAPRYDLLNRMLSFRQDVAWRKRMARHLPEGPALRLLDVATGTADQIFSLMRHEPRITSAVGVDMSEGMLEVGREKIRQRNLTERITLRTGDATTIPEASHAYDAVTISFGIRNVTDVVQSLGEMRRVLRPGGRVLVLEFSLPGWPPFRALYLFYLRHVLPVLGGWLSGDREAYRYLNVTVETFPYGADFCALMSKAGLVNVQHHPLTFGIATIYQGDAPA